MSTLKFLWGALLLVLAGCTSASNEMAAGNIAAVNHVDGTAINWFSVNGYRVSGGGGRQCCVVLPIKWRPGLVVNIEWEVDPSANAKIKRKTKGYGFDDAAWAEHESKFKVNRTSVEIPEWPGTDSCGLKVHFLPCNQVKVTTSCWGYGSPDNPIKEPLYMKEPAVCPG
ncbi:DUF3304 domain-containing protein [Pseudomonas solani]|uniref:DUF3304 domain-containing protein n=1 Tax=Pseudomonas solani TaxID=2731552 RepID=UPI003F4AAE90